LDQLRSDKFNRGVGVQKFNPARPALLATCFGQTDTVFNLVRLNLATLEAKNALRAFCYLL